MLPILPPASRSGIPSVRPAPYHPPDMTIELVERVGRNTTNNLAAFGEFCSFVGRTFMWLVAGGLRWRNIRLIFPQMYEIGVRSVPVVAVTGAFIGMVMSIESYTTFKA